MKKKFLKEGFPVANGGVAFTKRTAFKIFNKITKILPRSSRALASQDDISVSFSCAKQSQSLKELCEVVEKNYKKSPKFSA